MSVSDVRDAMLRWILTRHNIRQAPERRLYLGHRARVLGDKVLILLHVLLYTRSLNERHDAMRFRSVRSIVVGGELALAVKL